jgi:hypothetical protein
MIINNEFREYQKIAEEIDRLMYFVNLDIRKGLCPHNECGVIYIDNKNSEEYFASELVHEAGHSVFDPITTLNYVECAYEIKKALSKDYNIDEETLRLLANISSDIINEYNISKSKKLSEFRAKGIEWILNNTNLALNVISTELLAIYSKLHGFAFPFESKLFRKVKKILEKEVDRKKRYVEIARAFLELMQKEQKDGEKGKDGEQRKREKETLEKLVREPIKVDQNEYEKIKREIMKNSKNIEEAKEKLKILVGLLSGWKPIEEESNNLVEFYQEKANEVIFSVDYPVKPSFESTKIGSRLWKLSDGVDKIDIKRTIMKFGVNIPLVTTQTKRVFPKALSNIVRPKPVDLVISIDISGSTGKPQGYMSDVSDYEVITVYAVIDYAKRIEQNVGLTLWSDYIKYTTLPKVYSWRDVDILKSEILNRWWGFGTNIACALEQANDFKDKLFFIFTDGKVLYDHLDMYKDRVDNVMFFLIQPENDDYQYFVKTFGEERVIRIDKLEDIPTVTLKFYKNIFRVG